jgi:hypothetical protein
MSSSPQITRHLFMIEPAEFNFNPMTAPSNPYQQDDNADKSIILQRAINEFRSFVSLLIENGVHVSVAKGIEGCPDHIFPNWFSTHEGRQMMLYPMLTENRAAEKTSDIIATLSRHYDVQHDWGCYEKEGKCLEGLSSLILDRVNKKAYGTFSARTDSDLAPKWCDLMGYEPFLFETHSHTGDPIYHSDVMMHIGDGFVGICSESIEPNMRGQVIQSLSETREIIDLTMDQVRAFAGNALAVCGEDNKQMLIMSQSGYDSLTDAQRTQYLKYIDRFITPALPTIQYYGGGAARCMLQELF